MSNTEQQLPEELYQQLPKLLSKPCLHFTTPQEREACLLSMLTVLSGLMHRYQGQYIGADIHPNLHSYIIHNSKAIPAFLKPAKRVCDVIDTFHTSAYNDSVTEYPQDIADYKKELRKYKQGKTKTPPFKVNLPEKTEVYITGDINQNSLLYILNKNEGKLNIFDVNIPAIQQVYPDSYLIPLLHSSYNNQSYKEYNHIDKRTDYLPRVIMSVCAAGSINHITKLIPNTNTTLHKEYCYYIADNTETTNTPFSFHNGIDTLMDEFNEMIENLFMDLDGNRKILYYIAEDIQERFIKHYSLSDSNNKHYEAKNCYRISMILSMLFYYEQHDGIKHKSFGVTNHIMDTAMTIANHYTQYNREVYNYIDEHSITAAPDKALSQEHMQAAKLKGQGLSLREISKEMFGDESKFMRVKRLLGNI